MDDTTPTNDKRYLNSGFMLLRNTPATRAFGRAYLAQLQRRRTENDQTVFNDVLVLMSGNGTAVPGRATRLRTLVLDSRVFACGYFFYEYRHRRPLNASNVIAVHHNWYAPCHAPCHTPCHTPCYAPCYALCYLERQPTGRWSLLPPLLRWSACQLPLAAEPRAGWLAGRPAAHHCRSAHATFLWL